jgi:hypothetical protein
MALLTANPASIHPSMPTTIIGRSNAGQRRILAS